MQMPSWLRGLPFLRARRQRGQRLAREALWSTLEARRLEPRRVLNASFQALVVPTDVGEGDTVEASADAGDDATLAIDWNDRHDGQAAPISPEASGTYPPDLALADDGLAVDAASTTVEVVDVVPSIEFLATSGIDGEGMLLLTGGVRGGDDSIAVEIDWGNPLSEGNRETVLLEPGTSTFAIEHQFAGANDGAAHSYTITALVANDDGDSLSITVDVQPQLATASVAPSELEINPIAAVNEGEQARLSLSFQDPDAADTHTVTIDWDDGSLPSEIELAAGQRSLVAQHRYLDDNPSGTPADDYTVDVTITDSNGDSTMGQALARVRNVAPEILFIDDVPTIDENGTTELFFAFSDAGSLDIHTITVDWGDGTAADVEVLSLGNRQVLVTHQYLDDPSGDGPELYDIAITIADDDGGSITGSATAEVRNVAPHNLVVNPVAMINENGIARLDLSFDDPGTLDVHTVEIDWGDGTAAQQIVLPVGQRNLTATHRYLDDNPSGTSQDTYTIQVTVADDDGGSIGGETSVLVKNVKPEILFIDPVAMIDEDGTAELFFAFSDAGSLDIHTITVDWGDGSEPLVEVLSLGNRQVLVTHQYLDDNPTATPQDSFPISITIEDDDGGSITGMTNVLVKNVAPRELEIDPVAMIDENGTATLTLSFDDPGTLDTHEVAIDWGDGSAIETIALPAGERSLTVMHQHLDDNPTGTPQDEYTIQVTVTDDDTGQVSGMTNVLVKNVAPRELVIDPVAMIDENGAATLTLSFDDPGTLDTHEVAIDWGDGSAIETIALPLGERSLTVMHQYLDDNPTGTPQDEYTIQVAVTDDDTSEISGMTNVLVKNVAPRELIIDPVAMIDENGTATLTLSFDDPGTLDTHVVSIDWGDGSAIETVALPLGERTLTVMHQYLDDNPTGTPQDDYTIQVTVTDDDTGQVAGMTSVLVKNVAPRELIIDPVAMIDENGTATLTLAFDDPGTHDTHEVSIDWGDGSAIETIALPAGERSLTVTHQYLDDNPTGTPQDEYEIQVTVTDDDTGQVMGMTNVLVKNVAPRELIIDPVAMIDENGTATLTLAFDDPGTLDMHEVSIDWGDGSAIETIALPAGERSLTVMHQYLDDNPTGTPQDDYTIQVTVTDDDTGQVAGMTNVLVKNVAPVDLQLPEKITIDETDFAAFTLLFEDVGTLDTHRVVVDWGDGSALDVIDLPLGERMLTVMHDYSGVAGTVFLVQVEVTDDDTGTVTGMLEACRPDDGPMLANVLSTDVLEGDQAVLSGAIVNPVARPLVLEVNWGDGTVEEFDLAAGQSSFSVAHYYADDGQSGMPMANFSIEARLFELDGAAALDLALAESKVTNVDPTLFGTESVVVDEGQTFTLAELDVGLTDPGFDNPDDPAGPTAETFVGLTIEWGDGSPPEAITIGNRNSGGPERPTTADIVHTPHTYADNGQYTVEVTVQDDDGDPVTRPFEIEVRNVAPTLVLNETLFAEPPEIDEGSHLEILDLVLGAFTDPGFNNPDNPLAGPDGSRETFTYTINWGDGTGVDSFDMVGSLADGRPGMPTAGTLLSDHSHFYADNDADNIYTVTVTITDDDGGSASRSFDVRALNVNPTLEPLVATDVTSEGETVLTLEFSDPGADSFEILVDWGDKLDLPADERFVVVESVPKQAANAGPQSFEFVYKYDGPPDPDNPSADIHILVKIRDDDFGTAAVMASGESNVEENFITNPGVGGESDAIFVFDLGGGEIEGQLPETNVFVPPPIQTSGVATVTTTFDLQTARAELLGSSEKFLELIVVFPDGTLSKPYKVNVEVLDNFYDLFRKLPNNRYLLSIVRVDSNFRRLVADVTVFEGRPIDPTDQTDGTRDRPPTREEPAVPLEENPLLEELPGGVDLPAPPDQVERSLPPEVPAAAVSAADAEASGSVWEQLAEEPAPDRLAPHARRFSADAALLGLGGMLATESWADRFDRAVQEAGGGAWKRLSRAARLRRRVIRPDGPRDIRPEGLQ